MSARSRAPIIECRGAANGRASARGADVDAERTDPGAGSVFGRDGPSGRARRGGGRSGGRSATLALLHFDEYLALLRRVGLDVCPSGPLASALRTGLSRVCLADGLRLRAHG
jgi:hypothetical protein